MGKFRFELFRNGVFELMRSAEMQAVLQEHAEKVKQRAGDGYEMDTYVGPHRANCMIFANTADAWRDNLENNTLLKALR